MKLEDFGATIKELVKRGEIKADEHTALIVPEAFFTGVDVESISDEPSNERKMRETIQPVLKATPKLSVFLSLHGLVEPFGRNGPTALGNKAYTITHDSLVGKGKERDTDQEKAIVYALQDALKKDVKIALKHAKPGSPFSTELAGRNAEHRICVELLTTELSPKPNTITLVSSNSLILSEKDPYDRTKVSVDEMRQQIEAVKRAAAARTAILVNDLTFGPKAMLQRELFDLNDSNALEQANRRLKHIKIRLSVATA